MQIDPLAKVGHILGTLIRNTGDIIFVDEHNGGVVPVVRLQFIHVDHGAVRNAANALKPGTPLAFKICRIFGLAAEGGICPESNGTSDGYQRIEAK